MTRAGKFGPAEARYLELLWPAVIDHGALGELSWLSGTLSLAIGRQEWQGLAELPVARQNEIGRIYQHETWHAVQFATMGFLYRWASEARQLVAETYARHDTGRVDDFSGVLRIVQGGADVLDDVERQRFEDLFARLDRPGAGGLTTRAIVESQAYVIEVMNNTDVGSLGHFLHLLDEAPQLEYRVAFDYVNMIQGPEGSLEWFPLVASVALCTVDPPEAIDRLATSLVDLDIPARTELRPDTAETAMQLLMSIVAELQPSTLGDGAGALDHEIFRGMGTDVVGHLSARDLTLAHLFAFPDMGGDVCIHAIDAPMMFSPETAAEQFAVQLPNGMDEGEAKALLTMAGMGKRIATGLGHPMAAVGAERVAELGWLARPDWVPILFSLSDEQLETAEPGALEGLCRELVDRSDYARLGLRLPASLDPDDRVPLWADERARTLVCRLDESVPELPFLLHPAWALTDWIGCRCGPEAFDPDWQLDGDHPDVVASMDTLAVRAADLRQERGDNLRVLLTRMVR